VHYFYFATTEHGRQGPDQKRCLTFRTFEVGRFRAAESALMFSNLLLCAGEIAASAIKAQWPIAELIHLLCEFQGRREGGRRSKGRVSSLSGMATAWCSCSVYSVYIWRMQGAYVLCVI